MPVTRYVAAPYSRRQRPTAPSAHTRRRALPTRRNRGGHLPRGRGGDRVSLVVPMARRARDRAAARTAARALALPSLPSVADLTSTETLAALGLPTAEPS